MYDTLIYFCFLFLCWNDIFDISADKISHFTSQLTQMEFNQRIRMSTNVKKSHSYIWWFKTTQSHDYFIHRMLSSCISISITNRNELNKWRLMIFMSQHIKNVLFILFVFFFWSKKNRRKKGNRMPHTSSLTLLDQFKNSLNRYHFQHA